MRKRLLVVGLTAVLPLAVLGVTMREAQCAEVAPVAKEATGAVQELTVSQQIAKLKQEIADTEELHAQAAQGGSRAQAERAAETLAKLKAKLELLSGAHPEAVSATTPARTEAPVEIVTIPVTTETRTPLAVKSELKEAKPVRKKKGFWARVKGLFGGGKKN